MKKKWKIIVGIIILFLLTVFFVTKVAKWEKVKRINPIYAKWNYFEKAYNCEWSARQGKLPSYCSYYADGYTYIHIYTAAHDLYIYEPDIYYSKSFYKPVIYIKETKVGIRDWGPPTNFMFRIKGEFNNELIFVNSGTLYKKVAKAVEAKDYASEHSNSDWECKQSMLSNYGKNEIKEILNEVEIKTD